MRLFEANAPPGRWSRRPGTMPDSSNICAPLQMTRIGLAHFILLPEDIHDRIKGGDDARAAAILVGEPAADYIAVARIQQSGVLVPLKRIGSIPRARHRAEGLALTVRAGKFDDRDTRAQLA